MDRDSLLERIDKIFRANTIEDEKEVGQFGQTKPVKVIKDIEELKTDIKDLIINEFKKGMITHDDIFMGHRKVGGAYHINDAIKVAKEWGYNYVAWNGGKLWTINGQETDIYYNEL